MILILTLLGAVASVGFSCFQINKQEAANLQTQTEIRQMQEMQRQAMAQQQRLLPRNQATPAGKAVRIRPAPVCHVYASPAPAPAKMASPAPARKAAKSAAKKSAPRHGSAGKAKSRKPRL